MGTGTLSKSDSLEQSDLNSVHKVANATATPKTIRAHASRHRAPSLPMNNSRSIAQEVQRRHQDARGTWQAPTPPATTQTARQPPVTGSGAKSNAGRFFGNLGQATTAPSRCEWPLLVVVLVGPDHHSRLLPDASNRFSYPREMVRHLGFLPQLLHLLLKLLQAIATTLPSTAKILLNDSGSRGISSGKGHHPYANVARVPCKDGMAPSQRGH